MKLVISRHLVKTIDEVLPSTNAGAAIQAQVGVIFLVKNEFFDDVKHLTRLREYQHAVT